MSESVKQITAAQAAPPVPAQDGDSGGGVAVAEFDQILPMACHIGHISPKVKNDGALTVEIWDKHIRVKRPCHVRYARPAIRGKVNGLSPRASRRLRWAIENTPDLIAPGALFICLTYPAEWPRDGRTVKRHLDVFGKRVRRFGGFFAWALEYQTRGAPHFHLLARFPDGWDIVRVREWVAPSWFEVVASGDEKHLHAGTSAEYVKNAECAGWYISHYLGKEYQKTVPDGVTLPGRMWGMIGIKTPKPKALHFYKDSREGIELVRNIRRWASSDYAFRQRTRHLTLNERKSEARLIGDSDPYLRKMLLDFKNYTVTSIIKPENRKSWSPHDPGREKGFSVRNGTNMMRRCLDIMSKKDYIK